MNRFLVCFLFVCLIVVSASVLGQQPAQERPKTEPQIPQFDLDQYQFGLLKRGPKWTAEKTPELQQIQAGHMANIEKMAKAGKLFAAGPILDDGDLRGIFIFKAASVEEARKLADDDPAIKVGRLTLELLTWQGIKGIGAKLQEEMKKDENPKYTMTKYHLVLLKSVPNETTAKLAEDEKLLSDHLWHIRRMLDSKKMVTAGPFSGNQDLRGLYVFATESPNEAKAWAESDPAVKAGLLVPEIHPWFVAKEVWP